MVDERIEHDYLEAAAELVGRQAELLRRVEMALGIDPYEYWVRRSLGQPKDSDPENDGEWRWTFHGLEVDIAHMRDERLVRVDFGPHARRDVFTDWGIGLFVCHAQPHWREFPRLRAALDQGNGYPKFDVVNALGDAQIRNGCFEYADAPMVALVEKYTTKLPNGATRLAVPKALQPDPPEDMFLCMRYTLSKKGRQRLEGGRS